MTRLAKLGPDLEMTGEAELAMVGAQWNALSRPAGARWVGVTMASARGVAERGKMNCAALEMDFEP